MTDLGAPTDIAAQRKWYGQTLSTDDWKLLFMSALKQEMRLVPNLDATGFVQQPVVLALDREMADLMQSLKPGRRVKALFWATQKPRRFRRQGGVAVA